MTERVMNEIQASKDEKKVIAEELDRSKTNFAKYILSEQDAIKYQVNHPYAPTKKELRRQRRERFLNKLKKVFGL